MNKRTSTPPFILGLITATFVVGVMYSCLEIVARMSSIVDTKIAHQIAASSDPRHDLATLAAYTRVVYGWDWPPILVPTAGVGEAANPAVLLLGDSVTRGFGVDEPQVRSFPVLLQKALSKKGQVLVVNASVPGFGVDQMVLKLASELAKRKPKIVIVAYIPRDLYRTGRDINFGITKPVLSSYHNLSWAMRPAPDIFDFYQGYLAARAQFRLGPWWLGFLAQNEEFYLPMMNRAAYEDRFKGIQENLHDLGALHKIRILLVRLGNGSLGGAVAALDRWATSAFKGSTESNPRFVDLEPCARLLAKENGLDFDQAFSGHPGTSAHEIFARCLAPVAVAALAEQR